MCDQITEYTIDCVKGREDFVGTLEDAIRRADEMDREWQPAYGVEVWWGDELKYTTGDFA
jgi:hypothetical protein